MLTDAVSHQDSLDLGNRIKLAYLEIFQFGVGIGDEVVNQLIHLRRRRCCLARQLLTQRITVTIDQCRTELLNQPCFTLTVFILTVGEDTFERCSS